MQNPKNNVFIGHDAHLALGTIFQEQNIQKILLVCGKSSYESSGASQLLQPLLADLAVCSFNDFSANPKIEDIKKAIALCQQAKPDAILAVGGGSAMDLAKATKALGEVQEPVESAVESNTIHPLDCPLIAIPTTAGTGSEATHFAVVYINGKKYSLAHPKMLPDFAIVDPQFSNNMSRHLRAVTGMDALCQAIESYWAVSATHQSQELAMLAIKLIVNNFEAAMSEHNIQARERMAEASYFAGAAINVTKTTAPHALSYWLTSQYHIPHGHAVALNCARFIYAHGTTGLGQLSSNLSKKQHHSTMENLYHAVGCNDATSTAKWFNQLLNKLSLESEWSQLGLKPNKIAQELVSNCNLERMQNNPKQFSEKELIELISSKV